MDYNKSLGLLERALQRRIDNLPNYKKQMQDEIDKVNGVLKEFEEMITDYKYDEKLRKTLGKDERLISLAGSKTKLNKLLKDEEAFVKLVEVGAQRFKENYSSIETRYRLAIEEVEESLSDVKTLLSKIKDNTVCHEELKIFLSLFMQGALTDWEEFENAERQREEELENQEATE